MSAVEKREKVVQIEAELTKLCLPGLSDPIALTNLAKQLVDSIRRVQWVQVIAAKPQSAIVADPSNSAFDPVKASVYHKQSGNVDEACWLLFLAIHCGKHLRQGWLMLSKIYQGASATEPWSWDRITNDFDTFENWYRSNSINIDWGFGNHRKYETLKPNAPRSILKVFRTYISWAGDSHIEMFNEALNTNDGLPRETFDLLYKSMDTVTSFGRTAKFDYLCMLSKTGLLNIEPGKTYMAGSTGPKAGALLLFEPQPGVNASNKALESLLIEMESKLSLGSLGMQVLEDAICNWQKHPKRYKLFRG